MKKYFSF